MEATARKRGRPAITDKQIADLAYAVVAVLRKRDAVRSEDEAEPVDYVPFREIKEEVPMSPQTFRRVKEQLYADNVSIAYKPRLGHYIGQPYEQINNLLLAAKRMKTEAANSRQQLLTIHSSAANGAAIDDLTRRLFEAYSITTDEYLGLLSGGLQDGDIIRIGQLLLPAQKSA